MIFFSQEKLWKCFPAQNGSEKSLNLFFSSQTFVFKKKKKSGENWWKQFVVFHIFQKFFFFCVVKQPF